MLTPPGMTVAITSVVGRTEHKKKKSITDNEL